MRKVRCYGKRIRDDEDEDEDDDDDVVERKEEETPALRWRYRNWRVRLIWPSKAE